MNVFVAGKWRSGFLDEHRAAGEYRVQTLLWRNLKRLDELYFVRKRDVRMLVSYLPEIGVREVIRKVTSREQERFRNEKYLSCGVGRVLEAPDGPRFAPGSIVMFFASHHPACMERVVLPEQVLSPWDGNGWLPDPTGALLYARALPAESALWARLGGWHPASGDSMGADAVGEAFEAAAPLLGEAEWTRAERWPHGTAPITERSSGEVARPTPGKKRVALFGYGNYAKTALIPGLGEHLEIECIHEMDPTQIPMRRGPVTWDTAPVPRDSEDYDVFSIAGYHHTHAPIAVEALRRGRTAVIEKPIAVDRSQLAQLVEAADGSPGSVFACFQRRYSPLNEYLRKDLGVDGQNPVSYHCVVYEVALPALHWYRWQNSKSRLISNGCHWIDHFLMLNGFCEVYSSHVFAARDGTINCSIELVNGAVFTMALGDRGSSRIGLQDYVEVTNSERTARIRNSSAYVAETRDRVVRRARIRKTNSYREMYEEIGRRIATGERGDTVTSLVRTGETVLRLEELYRRPGQHEGRQQQG